MSRPGFLRPFSRHGSCSTVVPASALSLARKGSTVLSSPRTSERNQLVVAHLRNVKAAASRLKVSPSVRDDLISAGYEGLVRAGDRFDPSAKATFTTFSFRAVLGMMFDVLQADSRWAARRADIDADEVVATEGQSAERLLLTTQVLAALETLPDLPRKLIRAHFLEEETLSSVGKRFGISKTKASIELGRALQLLREKLDDSLADWPVHHPATKRRFSNEQKDAVIRRACQPGTNVAELGREVDIPAATIHTWLRSYRDNAKATLPLAA